MENQERNELSQWTEECAALLAPPADWEPNLNAARARFEARLQRRFRMRRYLLAVATAALLAAILIPTITPARVFAQQLRGNSWYRLEQFWYWITIVRTPLRLSLRALPEAVQSLHTQALTGLDVPQEVSDAAEAARRVSFLPRFPRSGVLSGRPRLSVRGPISIATVIRTADLELALRNAGVFDQYVPKDWDGARIALQIGATLTAEWTNVPEEWSGETEWSHLTFVQIPPTVIATPPGFDLTAFTVLNLRTALLNQQNALRFAQRPTTAPALIFGSGTQKLILGREVALHKGPATLIEQFEGGGHADWFGLDPGPDVERITLLWSVSDRVYVLSGAVSVPREMMSLHLAGALAHAIDLANTVE